MLASISIVGLSRMLLGCNIRESKLWARINNGASVDGLSAAAIAAEEGGPHTRGLVPRSLLGEDNAAFP